MWDGEKRIGQIDVHYAHDTIHATVIFEADLTVSEEEELLAQIDDDIVSSYLPRFEREDFVAHVFEARRSAATPTAPAQWTTWTTKTIKTNDPRPKRRPSHQPKHWNEPKRWNELNSQNRFARTHCRA